MIIKQYVAGPIGANNYLVADEKSREAVLIDCSERVPQILEDVKSLGLRVKYILLTHGHFDHVMGINDMKKELGAEVLINQKDENQIEMTQTILRTFGIFVSKNPEYDGFIGEGATLSIGDIPIKIFETPGHTEGGMCYLIEDKLFSGDTLFKHYVGRTDLPGGNYAKLENSIKNVLYSLPDETEVYPGHNEMTTIGYEKEHNEII